MLGRPSAVICVAVVAIAACGGGGGDRSNVRDASPRGCAVDTVEAVEAAVVEVAASVAPITNIVSVVAAGGGVEVVGLVPEGVNSHTFAPQPSVAATLERADIVFLNGLGLEAPLRDLAVADSDGVVCDLGDRILPRDEYIFDFSFPEAAGRPNPHLWTNPPMVRAYVEVVRDVLSAADPDGADRYRDNADRFVEQIDRLDAAVRAATESIPPEQRLLLTYHDAYAYFGRQYGWAVVGAVQPASFNDPTPREVAALVTQIDERGVRAIFGSEVFPSPVLRQLAAETGAIYVDDLRDDDLPGDPGDVEHSWLELMRKNVITIVDALGGSTDPLRTLDLAPFAADEASYP